MSRTEAPPLPERLPPYPVVAGIDFAEGPIFDAQGNLYFVNYLRNGTIGRRTPDGSVHVWCETGGQANGLKVDATGYVIAADYGGRRILRIHPDGKPIEVLTQNFDGEPYLKSYPAGGDQVTNLCWWETDLYVTVAGQHSIHRFAVGCRGA